MAPSTSGKNTFFALFVKKMSFFRHEKGCARPVNCVFRGIYFRGKSFESKTIILYSLGNGIGYTSNPFGNRIALSFGCFASISITIVFNLKFRIELAVKIIVSKVNTATVSHSGSDAT